MTPHLLYIFLKSTLFCVWLILNDWKFKSFSNGGEFYILYVFSTFRYFSSNSKQVVTPYNRIFYINGGIIYSISNKRLAVLKTELLSEAY